MDILYLCSYSKKASIIELINVRKSWCRRRIAEEVGNRKWEITVRQSEGDEKLLGKGEAEEETEEENGKMIENHL